MQSLLNLKLIQIAIKNTSELSFHFLLFKFKSFRFINFLIDANLNRYLNRIVLKMRKFNQFCFLYFKVVLLLIMIFVRPKGFPFNAFFSKFIK